MEPPPGLPLEGGGTARWVGQDRIAWSIDNNSSLDFPNAFKARQSYWNNKHPEWFEGDPAA